MQFSEGDDLLVNSARGVHSILSTRANLVSAQSREKSLKIQTLFSPSFEFESRKKVN